MKRIALFLCLVLAAACKPAPRLETGSWDPAVRASLDSLLAKGGHDRYAVFDFDKTTIAHDISQALWVYQIEHLRFADAPKHDFLDGIPEPSRLMPGTHESFAKMGEMLKMEYALLANFYKKDPSLDKLHDMTLYKDFRARMFSMLLAMDEAFGEEVSCLWMPGLLAGFTPAEARKVVREAVKEHLGKDKLAVQEWRSPDGRGGGMVERGIWLAPEMKDLYRCLKKARIDAYVCSASLELIVEALACDPELGLGLPPEQVFGLRFVGGETVTPVFDSTYVQPMGPGKVACIKAFMMPAHKGQGPVLVGGDSNGDVPMLTAFEDMQRGLIIDVGRPADSPIGQLAAKAGKGIYLRQPAFAKAEGAVPGGGI